MKKKVMREHRRKSSEKVTKKVMRENRDRK